MNPRALIIEVSPDIAHLERSLLAQCGFIADVTTDPAAGLDRAAHGGYDAILLGGPLFLPEREERTQFIDALVRRNPAAAGKVVVATTAVHNKRILQRYADANVYAVVAKPFDIWLLRRTIEECVARRGPSDATRWIGVSDAVN
jgi:CheY-like chemotaxis protein